MSKEAIDYGGGKPQKDYSCVKNVGNNVWKQLIVVRIAKFPYSYLQPCNSILSIRREGSTTTRVIP